MSDQEVKLLICDKCGQRAAISTVIPTVLPGASLVCAACAYSVPADQPGHANSSGPQVAKTPETADA